MGASGERYYPDSRDPEISLEHWHRYLFASNHVVGKDVLDVACGEGYGTALLARRARNVTGVDRDFESIQHASGRYMQNNLRFVCGSTAELETLFAPQTFSAIVSFETLEHLPAEEQQDFVGSAARLLTSDGIFIVSTPNPVAYNQHRGGDRNPFHLRELSLLEYVDLLRTYFGHVTILGQRIYTGSYMWNSVSPTSSQFQSWSLVLTEDGFRPMEEPLEAHYFVAVCTQSTQALATSTSFLIDGSHRMLRLRNEMIDQLQADNERLRNLNHSLEDHLRTVEADLTNSLNELKGELQRLQATNLLGRPDEGWVLELTRAKRTTRARHHSSRDELRRQFDIVDSLVTTYFGQSRGWKLAQLIHRLRARKMLDLSGLSTSIGTTRQTLDSSDLTSIGRDLVVLQQRLLDIRVSKSLAAAQWLLAWSRILRGQPTFPTTLDLALAMLAELITRVRTQLEFDTQMQVEVPNQWYPIVVPRAEHPAASVVIPVHGNCLYTFGCLLSLSENADSTPFEVIVVDDASDDDTPRMLAAIEGIKVIRLDVNEGYGSACNKGAQASTGKIVVFLNNDTRVRPGWLTNLLRTFDTFARVGAVGSKLVYPSGRLQEAGGVIWQDGTGWNAGRGDDPEDPRWNYVREVDYCSGASLAVRRDLFLALGGFDAAYSPAYYEDTDLAFRIRDKGFRVLYQPFSEVVHFEGATSGTDPTGGVKRFQEVNRTKFLRRWAHVLKSYPSSAAFGSLRIALSRYTGARVLVIDHMIPTPDRDSGSLRMIRMLEIMRSLNAHVTFIPHNLAYSEPYALELQLLGIETLYAPFVTSIEGYLREHGASYDVVVLSRISVAWPLYKLVRKHCPTAKLVFDTVDLHFLRVAREAEVKNDTALKQEASELEEHELAVARDADLVTVVSERERRELVNRDPSLNNVEILSNIHDPKAGFPSPYGRRGVGFIGSFLHPPNVDAVLWFVTEVWPDVQRMLPGIPFFVIGQEPPNEIRALQSDTVHILGYVHDLTRVFDTIRVSVAPLRYGAGVKGKINLSMSYGVPVVATPIAIEGMDLTPGEDVLLADSVSPEHFARHIVSLHEDDVSWERLSHNGVKNVQEHFSSSVARQVIARILGIHDTSSSLSVV
jgi:GT2 family glycosyltransferase/SAM-dependent methyltransferase